MDKIVALRHRLHRNAELSGQEYKTREIIKEFIRANTEMEPVEKEGCVYAVYRGGGNKTVALRTDFDALPVNEDDEKEYCSVNRGVSHRCGHDGHTAALCGAMLKIIEGGCKNNVIFMFQCAEETGAGGSVGANILKDLGADRVYGWHNIPGFKEGCVLLKHGTFCCGSMGIVVDFSGKPAHAAYPETGISPENAIRKMLEYMRELNGKEHKGLLHCTLIGIDCGGDDFGMAAYKGRINMTLRGELTEEYQEEKDALINRAQLIGAQEGLKCGISYKDAFSPVENNDDAVRTLEGLCTEKGWDFLYLKEPMRWSEDFAEYAKSFESCFFGIGDGETYPGLHTEKYDFPDTILERAINVLTELAKR